MNQANGVRFEVLEEPVVVEGQFLGGYGPGLLLSEPGLEVKAVAAPVLVAGRRGPLGSVPLGCGEVDLDHLVHGEVGLCDRAVGVQKAKLEQGGLHLGGCPVDDSGNLSPLSGQWIGSSTCPDLGLVGAEPVEASPAVCPSRHGGDRRAGPPLFRGIRAPNLCL